MTYTPDIRAYQQLREPITGRYDCTAYSAAILLDAHTEGHTKTTGRSVRLHSDEPIPDKDSPGLNLPQVDASVYKITDGKVNLDTRVNGQALTRGQVQSLVLDGRWCSMQLLRSVLVDRGFGGGNGFRGGHDATFHVRPIDNAPVMGDPLVADYIRLSWDAAFDAAEAFVRKAAPRYAGLIFCQFTRDLTPDYRVSIHPAAGYTSVYFWRYLLNADGQIIGRERRKTGGLGPRCTPPKWHGSAKAGIAGRALVQATEGSFKDWWFDGRYAVEIVP